MRRSSSMIYWYIPNFAPTCFSNLLPSSGGRSTSEATQVISVLWMYMDYSLSSAVSCREMRPHPSTTGPLWEKLFFSAWPNESAFECPLYLLWPSVPIIKKGMLNLQAHVELALSRCRQFITDNESLATRLMQCSWTNLRELRLWTLFNIWGCIQNIPDLLPPSIQQLW
jgi:hypothetical protein